MLLEQVVEILRSQITGSEDHSQDAQGPSSSIAMSIGTPPHTTTHAVNNIITNTPSIPRTNSSGTYPPTIPPHFYNNSPNMMASTSNNNTGHTCASFATSSQASLSRLFEPTRNKRLQTLASRRRTPTAVPWEHDFFCLAVPGQTTVPTAPETAELKKRGLGKKRVRFPDKEGTHLDVLKGLYEAYPPLKYGGGFKLYRGIRSKQLVEIPPQPDGYTIKYLKYESGLNRSVAYIVPLQEELRSDVNIPVIADELVIMFIFYY